MAGIMPTISKLHQLADMIENSGEELFIRWSQGPATDLPREQSSRDELTGVPMPGLSANPLTVESWWGTRPLDLWAARRLYDYRHLREVRGPGVRPWLLAGTVVGRGPDNEPLVICSRPIAWIADSTLDEAEQLIVARGAHSWGPLDRRT
jgi:hypothetical protein